MKREPLVDLGPVAIDVGYQNVKYTKGRKQTGQTAMVETGLFPAMAPRVTPADLAADPQWRAADGCITDVNGERLFVGPHAQHWSKGVELRTVEREYCMTPRYMALTRGALYAISTAAGGAPEAVVPDLAVGLPLSTFAEYRRRLKERLEGEHIMTSVAGVERRVLVERVHVLAQPSGCLVNFARSGKADEGFTLVVDVGGGTVDWFLATQKMASWSRSGAHPKAMLACAYAVADAAGHPEWRESPEIIKRIDIALRKGHKSFRASQQDWTIADFAKSVDAVVEESMTKMFEKLGMTADIDRVIVTGGGAPLFHKYLLGHPGLSGALETEDEPVFSNVLGFQFVAERQHGAAMAEANR